MGSRFDDIRAATDDTILVQSPPVGWQHYRDLPGRRVDDFSRRVEQFDCRVEEFKSQMEELGVVE